MAPYKRLAIKWVIGFSVRTPSPPWDGAISMDRREMEDLGAERLSRVGSSEQEGHGLNEETEREDSRR